MIDGFVLLYRKITVSWLWKRSDYFHWFCAILLRANFKDNNNFLFEGEFISVKRGQFVTSYRNLSNELCNCSVQKLRTFFRLLEKDKIIFIENIKKATRITICNYDSYQNNQHNSNTVATQQQHSSNTVATTIETKIIKENKENNEKKENSIDVENITKQQFSLFDIKLKKETEFISKVDAIISSMNGEAIFWTTNNNSEKTSFCNYWTESKESGKLLKFEMQKTFDIKRRMQTWESNNFNSTKGSAVEKYENKKQALTMLEQMKLKAKNQKI